MTFPSHGTQSFVYSTGSNTTTGNLYFGNTTFQLPTSYCTRDTAEPGCGFPSTNRELALVPRNLNDPNNYYALLGLVPWATIPEIKRRCRKLMATYHPDGSNPKPGLFAKITEIKGYLTDPRIREIYHSCPSGSKFVDNEVNEQVKATAQAQGRTVRDMVDTGEVLTSDPTEQSSAEVEVFYDYLFETPAYEGDRERAQIWYALLLEAAHDIDYRGPLKLMLTRSGYGFSCRSSLVRIPRGVCPTPDEAKGVLTTTTTVSAHG